MALASPETMARMLAEKTPARFLEQGRGLVEQLSHGDRDQLMGAMRNEGEMQQMLARLCMQDGTASARIGQMLRFIEIEQTMPADVQREGRHVGVTNMYDLPSTKLPYAELRTCALTEKGWPLDAELIQVDGRFARKEFDRPTVYFAHAGTLTLHMGDTQHDFTQGAQAALGAGTQHAFEGKGTLYALRSTQNANGRDVIEHFDDDAKKNNCPCGWSYRIPLVENGWDFSTHRTVMRGVHDATHDGFAGHQHKRTHEIYFTDKVEGDNASITVDGITFPLKPGMLIAIPNGTMHAVESEGQIIQHIMVGKGHKNDDFWTAGWKPLPKPQPTPAPTL